MKHVYVVEMYVHSKRDWLPCSACAMTSREAVTGPLPEMRKANPHDRFRISKYVYHETARDTA